MTEEDSNIEKMQDIVNTLMNLMSSDTVKVHFFYSMQLASYFHQFTLDFIYTLNNEKYDNRSERVKDYEKRLNIRIQALIIICFLDEIGLFLGKGFREELLFHNFDNDSAEFDLLRKNISQFREKNQQYFRSIRNSALAHKKEGPEISWQTIQTIDTVEFDLKFLEFGEIINHFKDAVGVLMKTILEKIKGAFSIYYATKNNE